MLDKSGYYNYNKKMRISNKALIYTAVLFCGAFFPASSSFSQQEPLETIYYDIRPVGESVYKDFGPIEYHGEKARLTIFETKVPGFRDKEVIFSEEATDLPILVQRDLTILLRNENITEEYSPKKHSFKLTKFVGGKKAEEYSIKGKGPIQNAILVPFSLRKKPDLKIGSTLDIILPGEFKVKLVSIEDIAVPAGKFNTYHFTSQPPKFEIWISTDSSRVPVKIKGLSGFPYTLEMKKREVR